MAQYEEIIQGYHSSVNQVQEQLSSLEKNLPGLVRGITWGITVFLIWMAFAQLGLFTQGWELLTRKSLQVEVSPVPSPTIEVASEAESIPDNAKEVGEQESLLEIEDKPEDEGVAETEEETNSNDVRFDGL